MAVDAGKILLHVPRRRAFDELLVIQNGIQATEACAVPSLLNVCALRLAEIFERQAPPAVLVRLRNPQLVGNRPATGIPADLYKLFCGLD